MNSTTATVSIAGRRAELERELTRAEMTGDEPRYRHAEKALEQLLERDHPGAAAPKPPSS